MPPIADPRAFLETLFSAAVSAADPDKVLAANLPEVSFFGDKAAELQCGGLCTASPAHAR